MSRAKTLYRPLLTFHLASEFSFLLVRDLRAQRDGRAPESHFPTSGFFSHRAQARKYMVAKVDYRADFTFGIAGS